MNNKKESWLSRADRVVDNAYKAFINGLTNLFIGAIILFVIYNVGGKIVADVFGHTIRAAGSVLSFLFL